MQSRGKVEAATRTCSSDAVAFAGVSKYPARVKCALLGWMAFKDAAGAALAEGASTEPQAQATS